MKLSVTIASLSLLLSACAIDGPQDDDDGGVETGGTEADEPGPDGVVGDPATTDGATPADPKKTDEKVCYPGADQSYTTCFALHSKDSSFGSAYSYPSSSSSAYQAPLRYVDLQAIDPGIKLAPNFTVGEVMQAWKGRYGVFQIHMIEKLQKIRSETGGALHINSGYRNPGYNKGVDGATYSRHMYGDGADMRSSVVSLSSMKTRCSNHGADYIGMYTSHIHCDWRYSPRDTEFFGNAQASWEGAPVERASMPEHAGAVMVEAGLWTAPATGFDEGEPYREWTALDADGYILEVIAATDYVPHPEAATIEVMVGGQIVVEASVEAPEDFAVLPQSFVEVRLDTLPLEH